MLSHKASNILHLFVQGRFNKAGYFGTVCRSFHTQENKHRLCIEGNTTIEGAAESFAEKTQLEGRAASIVCPILNPYKEIKEDQWTVHINQNKLFFGVLHSGATISDFPTITLERRGELRE